MLIAANEQLILIIKALHAFRSSGTAIARYKDSPDVGVAN